MYIDPNGAAKVPSNVIGKGVAHSRRWLVAYVRLYHEKKTAQRLTKMGIENFLPVQEEIHQWSDRKKKTERVLIPMMIFVHVNESERMQVLTLSSVSRYMVMYGENTPAVIPENQMNRFKFMLDYSDETVQITGERFALGEKVRVIKGKLAGLEGELVTIGKKTKIVVRIDMLGCANVDMPAGFVERIS